MALTAKRLPMTCTSPALTLERRSPPKPGSRPDSDVSEEDELWVGGAQENATAEELLRLAWHVSSPKNNNKATPKASATPTGRDSERSSRRASILSTSTNKSRNSLNSRGSHDSSRHGSCFSIMTGDEEALHDLSGFQSAGNNMPLLKEDEISEINMPQYCDGRQTMPVTLGHEAPQHCHTQEMRRPSAALSSTFSSDSSDGMGQPWMTMQGLRGGPVPDANERVHDAMSRGRHSSSDTSQRGGGLQVQDTFPRGGLFFAKTLSTHSQISVSSGHTSIHRDSDSFGNGVAAQWAQQVPKGYGVPGNWPARMGPYDGDDDIRRCESKCSVASSCRMPSKGLAMESITMEWASAQASTPGSQVTCRMQSKQPVTDRAGAQAPASCRLQSKQAAMDWAPPQNVAPAPCQMPQQAPPQNLAHAACRVQSKQATMDWVPPQAPPQNAPAACRMQSKQVGAPHIGMAAPLDPHAVANLQNMQAQQVQNMQAQHAAQALKNAREAHKAHMAEAAQAEKKAKEAQAALEQAQEAVRLAQQQAEAAEEARVRAEMELCAVAQEKMAPQHPTPLQACMMPASVDPAFMGVDPPGQSMNDSFLKRYCRAGLAARPPPFQDYVRNRSPSFQAHPQTPPGAWDTSNTAGGGYNVEGPPGTWNRRPSYPGPAVPLSPAPAPTTWTGPAPNPANRRGGKGDDARRPLGTKQPMDDTRRMHGGKPHGDDMRRQNSNKQKNVKKEKTTVMLRNLPEGYTRNKLTQLLDERGLRTMYDFVYMPMNFRAQQSFGYAFVNLVSHDNANLCQQRFDQFCIEPDRACQVSWSDMHQGLQAHVERYRNSPVMHESVPDEFKPAVFMNGKRVEFPPPTKKIRVPRVRRAGDGGDGAECKGDDGVECAGDEAEDDEIA